jgi:peptidoglycan/xylan/chitin deacetylase (PgdA/CDA1 family)
LAPTSNGWGILVLLSLVGKIAALIIGQVAPLVAVALWLGPDALIAYHLFVPRAQGLVRVHQRFTTSRREVWLTIDDGPDPDDTPRILELLATHNAHATFFVVGENAARHPELIRAIAAAGHEIAHHTHTHPHGMFWRASPARVRRELDDALDVLRRSGVKPARFRPPVGIKNLWLARALRERGLACIGWSARGLEGRSTDPTTVAARVVRHLAPGAILLLHEGRRVPEAIRVNAIRRVLETLNAQGYRCVVPTAYQLAD